MVATVNINPMQTTSALNSFGNLSDGFIQGMAMDDPAIRNTLAGGVLSASESLPMWGGVGIAELIAPPGSATAHLSELGNDIRRATSVDKSTSLPLAGFSVFDQAHHMINTPQSQVPIALNGMSVHFYRLGSGARVPVRCAASLISLRSGPVNKSNIVSWDFAAQMLVPYTPAYNAVTISGATWSSTSGGQVSFTVGTDLTAVLSAGSVIDVSGVVNSGGASTGAFNGTWVVVSVPDSTHVVVAAPASSSIGTYVSGGSIAAGGGALPIQDILTIRSENCMTVNYNSVTGNANWNFNDACALLLI